MINNTERFEIHIGEIAVLECSGWEKKPKHVINVSKEQVDIIKMFASTIKDEDLNTLYFLNGIRFKILPHFAVSA